MKVHKNDIALVVIDPQNGVLLLAFFKQGKETAA
jgi:hypothetical protein